MTEVAIDSSVPPQQASSGASDGRLLGFAAFVVTALSFLAYSPALGNGFYNDDALFLNHAARVLEQPSALILERPLGYLRPVWSLWVTALYSIFALEPWGYHFAGILLHAASSFLVFLVTRRLLRDATAGLAAAAFFSFCFAHHEATLWISAHNSSLMCFFALAALWSHLRAIESDSMRDAMFTAACVVLLLLTKEPGIVATAWLPLAEWRLRGLRACFTKRSLLRYAWVAAAGVIYLSINHRLLADAFADAGGGATQELRSTLGFVSIERLLGTSPWLFSPSRHTGDDLAPWLGVALFVGAIGLVALRSRGRLGDVLLAIAILVIALTTSCSTRLVQFNGSRLYYFPTVGAALLLGAVVAAFVDAAGRTGGLARLRFALAATLALLGAFHVVEIAKRNRVDYRPISLAQTHLAASLHSILANETARIVYLIEPWLDNEMHAREYLELFAGIAPGRVSKIEIPRAEAKEWLDRQGSQTGNPVLDCDESGRLFPASQIPNTRRSAQNTSREADSGLSSPMVRVFAIRR